ncbi:MAG: ribosome recycling factor [Patescibacteria group bacterium]
MPSDFIESQKPAFEAKIDHLRTELTSLRTGRANPQLVDGIQVEAYGTFQALVGLASITTPDAHTIQIEPWDKSIVKSVEKAIIEADLGLNPMVAGTVIRIPLPPLTEEGRLKMVKVLKEKLEDARIGVRQAREEARTKITAAEKASEISEDDKYRMHEDLDKLAAAFNDRIKKIGDEKEDEIMKI